MDKSTIIIILAVILLILIILNNITIVKTSGKDSDDEHQATCADTQFGCCPDGVNSKINYYGTNCPRYNPGPGYQVQPTPVQPNTTGLAIKVTDGIPGL